ncbi:MAG TPA: serine hydrolase [Anaerolineaceae bacterium]|nr:serine hydrolase [Anaerolineaceae bacterium]
MISRLRPRTSVIVLRWISIAFIFMAVLVTVFQLVSYSRIRSIFPPGMVIAGMPVGDLDQQQAADRIVQAYSVAVEIHYGDAVIQVKPAVLGFELDLESMMAAADLERINQPFWSAFWDYLWNRVPTPSEIPLRYSIQEDRLRSYLSTEIAPRYDQPASSSIPVPGSTNFQSGHAGTVMDVDRAVILLEDALKSPTARIVSLSYNHVNPPRPSFQNLQILLKQVISVDTFDGEAELYLLDLQTNQEIHFALQQGKDVPGDIAFTAASTIKIPIMVSIFHRIPEPTPKGIDDLLTGMIEASENGPADQLMQDVINKDTGPLEVTKDMQTLGLKDTFLAGYFYAGAPLLKKITTPGNQRTDINTGPDPYNQTTPAEMGMLLDDIYQCADMGGGALVAVFPGQFTQNKCKQMITYLIGNKLPMLITAGLPEGTQIAHKHGWITESDGLLHTIGDAGIVYTPGGNYVLSVYLHNQTQLLFDPANKLIADLSRAVYNYYNQPSQ